MKVTVHLFQVFGYLTRKYNFKLQLLILSCFLYFQSERRSMDRVWFEMLCAHSSMNPVYGACLRREELLEITSLMLHSNLIGIRLLTA
jgi:hypothetical protein